MTASVVTETISRIEVLDTGELLLGLESKGKGMYQHIYREAAGVYWDPDRSGFKSTPMQEWSCSKWFAHVVSVVRAGLELKLVLGESVAWSNVPDQEKLEIEKANVI
jgi:hypothetical protein